MWGLAVPLPSGDFGTTATVARMRQLARDAALTPIVRSVAVDIVEPPSTGLAHARRIAVWVTGRTRFLADPAHAEALHTPAWILQRILTRGYASVDCDDVAVLTAALGLAVGLRARFVIVGFALPHSPTAPYRHVWTELADATGVRWIAVDPTRPHQGRRYPVARRLVVEV